jgi:putative FmdB family regulatory protein
MPIYEFYCKNCHTIYNFFSSRVNTDKEPACPDPECGNRELRRQISLFSISRGRTENEGESDGLENLDEDKLEKAMMSMAGEMDNLDEDDPKQAARMMRKLFDSTGMKLGDSIEEAISRMEAGEDPDKIEQEMGDVLEDENPFAAKPRKLMDDLKRKYMPPKVDEHLYEL